MPTQAKIEEVARLTEKLESAVALVLADYRGVTANEMVELREKFTKEGLEYRVVKDTLAKIAANSAGIEGLAEMFEGPISIALSYVPISPNTGLIVRFNEKSGSLVPCNLFGHRQNNFVSESSCW